MPLMGIMWPDQDEHRRIVQCDIDEAFRRAGRGTVRQLHARRERRRRVLMTVTVVALVVIGIALIWGGL